MSSMPPGGMEMPVRRYSSAFQPKCTSSRPRLRASLTRLRTRRPASMTSGPIPSPGITAIRFVMAAADYMCEASLDSVRMSFRENPKRVYDRAMKSLAIIAALFLSSASLFASADLVTTVFSPGPLLRAGYIAGVFLQVRNDGPETASAVTVSVASTLPNTCACNFGDIPPGQTRSSTISFVAPATDATITVSATASSNTPDPNPSNNTASIVFTVSADPDLTIALATPFIQDLALPFTATVFLGNSSHTTAHDVEVTVDFNAESVTVKSLPDGCSSPT